MSKAIIEHHAETLREAIEAIHARTFYAHWPESPSPRTYGEEAGPAGQKAFEAQLGSNYILPRQTSDNQVISAEESPYTRKRLQISYPCSKKINDYIERSENAAADWKKAEPDLRAAILVESLDRIAKRFFELAHATMHTTGQAFGMSFQASGPHSNDRALEAVALGLKELKRFPAGEIDWIKPMGKSEITLKKRFINVPIGINLLIGCSTFPVWNTVPGLYASLVAGNTAICKPHPLAIYPIAIVVEELQETLAAAGFDPHIVQLAPDTPKKLITKDLAEHPKVKIIDYTGGNIFGDYIESLPGKRTFTEKAGINSVLLESCTDLQAMVQNIAFSLSLYSGQMCTCPQNIFIPKGGITVGEENVSYKEVVKALTDAITGLVTHEKMGPGVLGAVQNTATYERVQEAHQLGLKVLLKSLDISNPDYSRARMASPVVLEIPASKRDLIGREMFGPIVYIIPVSGPDEGLKLAKQIATENGAITFSAYSTDPDMREQMIEEMAETFTSISFNLVGNIWVNQSAGFSDFHVTGGNPAGNASLTDPEFVLGRFEIVGVRIHP